MSEGSFDHPPESEPDGRSGLAHHDDPRQWWRSLTGASDRPRRIRSSVSLERRWFGRGDAPADVASLFADVEPEQRTDRYAPLDRDDVGLKLRNGRRLGLKRRRWRLDLGDGLVPAERWTRCSARVRTDLPLDDWEAVHKRRVRHLVDLSQPTVGLVEGRRRPTQGGAVELVAVQREAAEVWWSVAVETWGPDDRGALMRMCRWLPIDWEGVERAALLAGSYPAWVRRSRS